MSVEVIGAGFGRTGTTSLKKALEILGFDDCYHANEVKSNGDCDFWVRVANKEPYDFDEAFNKPGKRVFRSTCDWPSALFWREQLARYPEAKVVLTVRDPEKWFKSSVDTVFQCASGPYTNIGILVGMYVLGMWEFQKVLFNREYIKNNWEKDSIIRVYNAHNAQVIAECPKDKLLVFEVSQGWEPLCKFLDKPIPSVPFPNVNDTKSMQKKIKFMSIVGYTAMALPVVLLTVGAGSVWWFTEGKGLNLKEMCGGSQLFSGLKSSDL